MNNDHRIYKKIIVVNSSSGDWSGIYLDNELWGEGHSITQFDWAELINNHHLESVTIREVEGEWVEYHSSFPNTYQEIPLEKFI